MSNPYLPPGAPVADVVPAFERKDGHRSVLLLMGAGLALLSGILGVGLLGLSLLAASSPENKDDVLLLLALSAFSVGCLASACGLYVRQFWGPVLWLFVTFIPSTMSILDPSRQRGDSRYVTYTFWFLLATAIVILIVEARSRRATSRAQSPTSAQF